MPIDSLDSKTGIIRSAFIFIIYLILYILFIYIIIFILKNIKVKAIDSKRNASLLREMLEDKKRRYYILHTQAG